MLIDLTTQVTPDQLDKFISTAKNKHIIAGHIGTHLDTYQKSPIPLEYFRRPGLLIDVSSIEATRDIEISDLKNIDIPKDTFVLFRTGRIENHIYGTKEYFTNHPQLSHSLIEYLIQRKISFVGIDCAGIRNGDEHRIADELCETNSIYVIENLCNLDKISPDSPFTVYTLWLDDDAATGLKCRVIAEILPHS